MKDISYLESLSSTFSWNSWKIFLILIPFSLPFLTFHFNLKDMFHPEYPVSTQLWKIFLSINFFSFIRCPQLEAYNFFYMSFFCNVNFPLQGYFSRSILSSLQSFYSFVFLDCVYQLNVTSFTLLHCHLQDIFYLIFSYVISNIHFKYIFHLNPFILQCFFF